MKKAIITVKSNTSEDTSDLIEITSVGEFYIIEDGFKVEYDETEISGMEGTKTTMIIKKDCFELIRSGTTETKMLFKKNKENVVLYKTPYGIMNMKTLTQKLNVDVNEYGGKITTSYILFIEDEQTVKTNLTVDILVNDKK